MAFSDDDMLTWPPVIFQCCLLTGFHVICTHLETQHVKMMWQNQAEVHDENCSRIKRSLDGKAYLPFGPRTTLPTENVKLFCEINSLYQTCKSSEKRSFFGHSFQLEKHPLPPLFLPSIKYVQCIINEAIICKWTFEWRNKCRRPTRIQHFLSELPVSFFLRVYGLSVTASQTFDKTHTIPRLARPPAPSRFNYSRGDPFNWSPLMFSQNTHNPQIGPPTPLPSLPFFRNPF